MTREEVLNATELISNGFIEMMKAFRNNPELETSCEQQPCEDDAISRQAVLEYIEASDAELGHSSENELVCQDIKELPPVTLQSKMERWIPVSEKPKEEGSYMTTLDYGEYGLVAGQRYYHGEDYGWSDVCVIAWMPLPKPYKPQERKNR